MLDILNEMQWRLAEMQTSLHENHTVHPNRASYISQPKAKKHVRWYLDSFSAAVAGARVHLRKIEEDEDNLYTAADKAEIRTRIGTRLEKEFNALAPVVQRDFNCQEGHILDLGSADVRPRDHEAPVAAIEHLEVQRQVDEETWAQLKLLDQALHPLREMLRDCMAGITS